MFWSKFFTGFTVLLAAPFFVGSSISTTLLNVLGFGGYGDEGYFRARHAAAVFLYKSNLLQSIRSPGPGFQLLVIGTSMAVASVLV